MRDYNSLMNRKARAPEASEIQQDIRSAANWTDAYWIGQYLFAQESGETDRFIIDAYEKAFSLGLNIRTDRDRFLSATQQLAKIYFQFCKYDEAINKLMLLDANVDGLPDWVNLYFASAQIHTGNILYWAEVPSMLFNRLDRIDTSNTESVKRRKIIFLEYLNRITELKKTTDISRVDSKAIIKKAEDLGLSESDECLRFQFALGIIDKLPDQPEISDAAEESELEDVSIYEQLVAELNGKLSELQTIIDQQKREIADNARFVDSQKRTVAELEKKKSAFEKKAERLEIELKTTKEYAYSLREKCNALESQLSGKASAEKQLENNAVVIGELRAEVEGLKSALDANHEEYKKLEEENQHNKALIDDLQLTLLEKEAVVQNLQSTIELQKTQIEAAEAAIRAAAERTEREAPLLEAPSRINPTREDIFKVSNFLPRREKILVIDGTEVKEDHLRGRLKNLGFNFARDQLVFELDYDNIASYTSRIKQYEYKYAGIIAGPCPHSCRDNEGYSSFIKKIESEEGYPHLERAEDNPGHLKLSKTSLGEAMVRMSIHLQSGM